MSVGKDPAGILSWRHAELWTPPSGWQAEQGSGARADDDIPPAWNQERECFAVSTIPTCQQDHAQSAEEIRAARDFSLLKGQNQVWLFPYIFVLQPMQCYFPCWWILQVVLALFTGNKDKGQNWTRILRKKIKHCFQNIYVCNNNLWEGLFFNKNTLKLRFIHLLSAFYLEALINDFFGFKYYQSKKNNRTGVHVLQARCVYTNVHIYIGRKKYPI